MSVFRYFFLFTKKHTLCVQTSDSYGKDLREYLYIFLGIIFYDYHLIEMYPILGMTWLKITHSIIVFCTLYLTIYLMTNVRLFRYIFRFTNRQIKCTNYFVASHDWQIDASHDLPIDECTYYFDTSHDLLIYR